MAFKKPDEILRKKLALAVKSIQWGYAIFWSTNPTKGLLEWSNGYYNGDIKTRKIVQAFEELDTDELGFNRTQQLRELYESLLDVETNTQSTRPATALSPEDLTDTEWYFMICMSYEFNIGQGLPGRTLEKNETIWLSNACYADSKVFSRALLARSALIQTVLCIPYAEVVLELGTTELVSEDFNIIQQMTTSLMGIPPTTVTTNSNYIYQKMSTREKDNSTVYVDQAVLDDSNIVLPMQMNEFNIYSTFDNINNINKSQGLETNCEVYKAQMFEGIDIQEQSRPFIDDGISNFALNFETSSGCISQTFPSPENLVLFPDEDMRNNNQQPGFQTSNFVEDQQTINEVLPRDGIKYVGIVSTILKSSPQLILGPCFQSNLRGSSFVRWKSDGFLPSTKSRNRGAASQRLLKKVVYEVAKMHSGCMLNNGSAEKRRRERIHEKLVTLGSVAPTGKVDKVSLHDDKIQYLKNLEDMVDDLESQDVVSNFDHEPRRKKPWGVMERTSDYYSSNGIRKNYKKMEVLNKIKGSDVNEKEGIYQVHRGDDFTEDVVVSKIEKNVVIEVKCTWRDGLLLEIMDAISNFGLDSYSVQSSNAGGKFLLTVKSKVKGPTTASIQMIKQVLRRVARKC